MKLAREFKIIPIFKYRLILTRQLLSADMGQACVTEPGTGTHHNTMCTVSG